MCPRLRTNPSYDATPDRITGIGAARPDDPSDPDGRPREFVALTVAWSLSEPERVGELVLFDDALPRVVGRGGARSDDQVERANFVRLRPPEPERRPPLAGTSVSRRHVLLTPDADGLAVERLGKGAVVLDGEPVDTGFLAPGGTLLLSNELLFLCERRPATAPQVASAALHFPFGETDSAGLTGETPAAWKLRDQARFVAGSGSPLLIMGAAGAGKEVVARAVHEASAWRDRPWLMLGGATLSRQELDQLVQRSDGPFVVIDELADVPPEVQPHLARTLTLTLGQPQPRARIVATSTSEGLAQNPSRDGAALDRVRPDLLTRFVLRLSVPSLDERRADIPLLVRSILLDIAREQPEVTRRFFVTPETGGKDGARPSPRISPRLIDLLLRHQWKANVRELTSILWLSMTTAQGPFLDATAEVLAQLRDGTERFNDPNDLDELTVRQALEASRGRVVVAARMLGLKNRWVLYRLLEKLDIRH